ncbi:MOSC N-terminal beta barrel domain-containing protein [Halomonas mongoliensis]|uniref:MOSC N-terminal beta barrel domain-containing protein n=1 Tax=Halomonas mongoliensis TaxID=321265 RepID=A0ABU1GHF6_9GAMM|nr:MOSC N-terminal beta barrel domain-containing protein [Halomonas mongoliensis]MDR5891436.1 MOSC N-terminal beta barrel domain-containing protein [Halomonas mongoliensis]
MRITQLAIYPVKSLGGIALDDARLTTEGLAWDRRWMVVDDVGRFVTQRQLPAMASIRVSLENDALVLAHPGMAPLRVALSDRQQERLSVYVWEDRCDALDEGIDARDWLAAVLGDLRGSRLRLVRFAPEHRRRVEPHHLAAGEVAHTGFADGYPVLVASMASLAELNRRLAAKGLAPVPMSCFRPNIVIEGAEPFAEDGWHALGAADGRWRLGLRKPCQRCKITTVDQQSGEIPVPGEPLRTLVEMNPRLAPGGYFGQNAIPLAGRGARLAVGDTLVASPAAS